MMVSFVGGTWDGVTKKCTISEDRHGQYIIVMPRVAPPIPVTSPDEPVVVEPIELEVYRIKRYSTPRKWGRGFDIEVFAIKEGEE